MLVLVACDVFLLVNVFLAVFVPPVFVANCRASKGSTSCVLFVNPVEFVNEVFLLVLVAKEVEFVNPVFLDVAVFLLAIKQVFDVALLRCVCIV